MCRGGWEERRFAFGLVLLCWDGWCLLYVLLTVFGGNDSALDLLGSVGGMVSSVGVVEIVDLGGTVLPVGVV